MGGAASRHTPQQGPRQPGPERFGAEREWRSLPYSFPHCSPLFMSQVFYVMVFLAVPFPVISSLSYYFRFLCSHGVPSCPFTVTSSFLIIPVFGCLLVFLQFPFSYAPFSMISSFIYYFRFLLSLRILTVPIFCYLSFSYYSRFL